MVESEKTAKWQYTRHCEELTVEIKKLREEVRSTVNNIYNNMLQATKTKSWWENNIVRCHKILGVHVACALLKKCF